MHTDHVLVEALKAKHVANAIALVELPEELGPGLDDDEQDVILALSDGLCVLDLPLLDLEGLAEDVVAVEVGSCQEGVPTFVSSVIYILILFLGTNRLPPACWISVVAWSKV